MREVFNTYTIDELRKLATSYNKNVKISGISTMKKKELIDALMKHSQHFKDLKPKEKNKAEPPKPTEKPTVRKTKIKKVEPPKPTEKPTVRKMEIKKAEPPKPTEKPTVRKMEIKKAEPSKPAEKKVLSDEDKLVAEWNTPTMPILASQLPNLKITQLLTSASFQKSKKKGISLNELIPFLPYKKLLSLYSPQDILDGLKDLVEYFYDDKVIIGDNFKEYFRIAENGMPVNTLKIKVSKEILRMLINTWLKQKK